jgi:hypothetical protein
MLFKKNNYLSSRFIEDNFKARKAPVKLFNVSVA